MLKFYFKLTFLKEKISDVQRRVEESGLLSKILKKADIMHMSVIDDEGSFSVYCEINDPEHVKKNDLYQEIYTYFVRNQVMLAGDYSGLKQ